MAGSHVKYRHLSRSSAHRQALLRNLVTSLIKHEHITTTWHKAKEAQRLAEKLITLGKRGTEPARRGAQAILFTPHEYIPKLFGELATRYRERAGGYTRVLRIEPLTTDQAASAILELVDGPKDTKWALTAKTLARLREAGREINDITATNVFKTTRYRGAGATDSLEQLVRSFELLHASERAGEAQLPDPRKREVLLKGFSAGNYSRIRQQKDKEKADLKKELDPAKRKGWVWPETL